MTTTTTIKTLSLAMLLTISACGGLESLGPDSRLEVQGTDGQYASKDRPAEIDFTQNAGQFTIEYEIGDFQGLNIQVLVVNDEGLGEELYYGSCSNDETCLTGTFSCTYSAGNSVSCTWEHGTTPTVTSLTQYFADNGGIPNDSRIALQGCFVDFDFRRNCFGAKFKPVVFR